MFNQVTLIGRIVRDPIVHTTKDGKAVTTISLAVRRPFKNSEGTYDTDFISCTAWKKVAETSGDYCTKGSLVCITGRIQMRNIDTGDNKRLSFSEIIAENITFLHLKRSQPQHDEIPIPPPTPIPASEKEMSNPPPEKVASFPRPGTVQSASSQVPATAAPDPGSAVNGHSSSNVVKNDLPF